MTADLAQRAAQRPWYHSIELPGGVVTHGQFDTRPSLQRIPFPADLSGKRCLDVGTSDGFWAFEMERRGAAEVVALDIDDPADYDWPEPRPAHPTRIANQDAGVNPNFALAHEALGSKVERVDCRIYDASPQRLDGKFDFVFMGSLMLHLRDPVAALAAVRTVVGGEFLSADSISLWLTLVSPGVPAGQLDADRRPRWWAPNLPAYRRMLVAAGFEILRSGGPYFIPFGAGLAAPIWNLTPRNLLFQLGIRRVGAPSAWALCRAAV